MVTSANFHSLPPISASVLSLRANAFALSERGGVAVLRADHPNLLIGKWLRTKVTPPRYSNVAVLLCHGPFSPPQPGVRVWAPWQSNTRFSRGKGGQIWAAAPAPPAGLGGGR